MKQLRITVEGKTYDVTVEVTDDDAPAQAAAAAAPAAAAPAAAAPVTAPPVAKAAEGDVVSPLAGVVQAIEVAAGASVNEGDLVITLEAMKMYTSINAPGAGTVTAIHVNVGDAVDEGQPLYTLG
ncbi:acetyl-CoA carboxylase biotin carboxyl carrier protein subunit [Verrucomicrobiaceae bacterium N1E253]|uniref:Acetyl-CoA carboxylase biotin carboxyl carrier protein subunit n=1 Tax=Oceaniferula marina TaxID=2748318 RepID=A0A851G9U5_9BACT|nr:biotin/lipoyl-containing protein [Oceaniferula marina]NWK54373.1 acetyl-CoA carboxylase biotin carboxyl carrier protein subunit [Oceaniferula marina]